MSFFISKQFYNNYCTVSIYGLAIDLSVIINIVGSVRLM